MLGRNARSNCACSLVPNSTYVHVHSHRLPQEDGFLSLHCKITPRIVFLPQLKVLVTYTHGSCGMRAFTVSITLYETLT